MHAMEHLEEWKCISESEIGLLVGIWDEILYRRCTSKMSAPRTHQRSTGNYKNPGQIISIISKLCIISNKLYKLYNFISLVYIIYITADASVTIIICTCICIRIPYGLYTSSNTVHWRIYIIILCWHSLTHYTRVFYCARCSSGEINMAVHIEN